jgi:hypothetical protein
MSREHFPGADAASAIAAWLLEENASRSEAYRKDLATEIFLARLNAALQPFENTLPATKTPTAPIFLFFGLPRCGKTFFSQLLTQGLDLGYVNNLAARLWRAPVTGMRLARLLGLEHGPSAFESDYGKTTRLTDPHDFHYFWQHWLEIDRFPYDAELKRQAIDWSALGEQLRRMSAFWGRPALFKAIDATWFMTEIVAAYPQAIFVHLERDPIDCACSLAKGRLDNYGTLDHWYGQASAPADHARLVELPWHAQIAGQLRCLLELFSVGLARLPESNVLRFRYDLVCSDPESVLDAVMARCRAFGREAQRRRGTLPAAIRYSRHGNDEPLYGDLAAALERQGVPLRLTAS